MIRLKSEQRYQDDPVFAAIVDTLYSMLSKSENSWTPTELREAAMLAALKYEYTHVRPMFVQQLDSLPSTRKHISRMDCPGDWRCHCPITGQL